MNLLLALLFSLVNIFLAEQNIRKHPAIWYCSAFVLSLLSTMLPNSAPGWLQSILSSFIGHGTLATALFILVMYARILPPKSRAFRTLMSLRAPLAIMASFMILIHNRTYFVYYHENARLRNISMTKPEIAAAACTTLMILLLIPLTITSFTFVRKKMKGTTWKKLQRLSYVFYGLIYIHVALVFGLQISRGNNRYQLELAIYTAIFGYYLVSRVALYLKNAKKINASNILHKIGLPVVAALSLGLVVMPLSKQDDTTADNNVAIEPESVALSSSSPSYQDGEWTGTAFGYNDDITVTVTIENGIITDITSITGDDDEPYFGWAKEKIPQQILSSQSTEIDTVSGATFSSKGIINAVKDALQKAQNPE